MTRFSTLLACTGLFLLSLLGARPAEGTLIEELDWLTGRWVMEERGQYVEETWSPAKLDAMCGMLRWGRAGKVWLYEAMSIEAEEDTLVLHIRHFGRGLEPWKSEAEGGVRMPMLDFGEQSVVFEDPASDDPRRIVYEREGDELTIRLENAAGEPTNRFRMKLDG